MCTRLSPSPPTESLGTRLPCTQSSTTAIVACSTIASYPGHVVGGKSGLVSTVCACAKNPMISWGIVYYRLRTVNLYRPAPKHGRLKLHVGLVNSEDFAKALKFGLCCIGKGYFTLKAEQLDAIKCISMVKTYSCGSHGIILGSLSAARLCRLLAVVVA